MDHIQVRRISDALRGELAYPDPQTVHVNKQTSAKEDGSASRPFKTVAAALTRAAAMTPTAASRVLVLIHPGTYVETGLTALQYVDMKGMERDSCILESGDANDILAIAVADVRVEGLTFNCTSTGNPVDIQVGGTASFFKCKFSVPDAASIIQVDGDVAFEDCAIEGTLTAVLTQDAGTTALVNSYVNGMVVVNAGHFEAQQSQFEGSALYSIFTGYDGLWSNPTLTLSKCRIVETVFHKSGGTAKIDSCWITKTVSSQSAALIFYTTTPLTLYLTNNRLEGVNGSNRGDVYVSSGSVTAAAYSGNSTKNGGVYTTGGYFYVTNVTFEVGGSVDGWYSPATVFRCINSTGTSYVRLHKSYSYSMEDYYAPLSGDVVVDLNGHTLEYLPDPGFLPFWGPTKGLHVDGDIRFTLRNGEYASTITVDGTQASVLVLENVRMRDGHIEMSSTGAGTGLEVRDSDIEGDGYDAVDYGHRGIDIQSVTPYVRCEDSYIYSKTTGAAEAYAVYWDAANNPNCEFYNCRFAHGAGSGSIPFGANGVTPTYKSEHCEFTSDPTAGAFTDSIPNGINGNVYLDNLVPVSGGTFTGLSDTPADYTGAASKTLKVTAGADGVEFVDVPASAVTFTALTDTPADYSGAASKTLKVTAGADGVEFVDVPAPAAFPTYYKILYVSDSLVYGTRDGSLENPYDSISSAVTKANTFFPSSTKRILIYVMPGRYSTSYVTVYDYIDFTGQERDTCIIRCTSSTAAFNVADGDNSFSNLTLQAASTGAQLRLNYPLGNGRPIRCFNVRFHSDGYVAEGIYPQGVSTGAIAEIECTNCIFDFPGRPAIDLTSSRYHKITLRNCIVDGDLDETFEDNGDLYYYDCHLKGVVSLAKATNPTTGLPVTVIEGCTLETPLLCNRSVITAGATTTLRNNHFKAGITFGNSTRFLSMTDNLFDAPVTGSSYSPRFTALHNNVLSDLASADSLLQVGGLVVPYSTALHVYGSVDSVDSVYAAIWSGARTIYVHRPESGASIVETSFLEIDHDVSIIGVPTESCGKPRIVLDNTQFYIYGNVDFINLDIRGVGTNEPVIETDFNDNQVLRFKDCNILAQIEVSSYASNCFILIEDSVLTCWYSGYPIRIMDGPDETIIIRNSTIKGKNTTSAAAHAIAWEAANDNLKVEYSNFHHGTAGGTDGPFGVVVGVHTPNYRSHHCSYNVDPEASVFTNLIPAAQRFDCISAEADYYSLLPP